jgi:GIY-YIG catalytic domain-containing protein
MNLEYIVKVYNIEKLPFKIWEHELAQEKAEESLAMAEANILSFVGGGIYRMYNAANEIIYVGKSNDIHRRLLQHVGRRSNTSYFISEATRIEYHVNNDPVYQTLLEGIFIAYHAPKYNDEIKDRNKLGGKENA